LLAAIYLSHLKNCLNQLDLICSRYFAANFEPPMVVYLSFLALLWDCHPLASATVTVKQLVLPTCLILALLLGYHLAECFKLLEVIESVTQGL
jgi:hypothetical protein